MGPLKLGPMPARAEGASAAATVSEVSASEKAIENREGKNGFMALNVTSPAGRWEAGNRQLRRRGPPASRRRAKLPGSPQSVIAAAAASWKARRTGESSPLGKPVR